MYLWHNKYEHYKLSVSANPTPIFAPIITFNLFFSFPDHGILEIVRVSSRLYDKKKTITSIKIKETNIAIQTITINGY